MDQTPDSWDQVPPPSQTLSGLSISAKPFVPNVNAVEFVPNFGGAKMMSTAAPPKQSLTSVTNPIPSPVSTDNSAEHALQSEQLQDEMDPANGR